MPSFLPSHRPLGDRGWCRTLHPRMGRLLWARGQVPRTSSLTACCTSVGPTRAPEYGGLTLWGDRDQQGAIQMGMSYRSCSFYNSEGTVGSIRHPCMDSPSSSPRLAGPWTPGIYLCSWALAWGSHPDRTGLGCCTHPNPPETEP